MTTKTKNETESIEVKFLKLELDFLKDMRKIDQKCFNDIQKINKKYIKFIEELKGF